uniref:DUF4974 domain-containing protein n=1 Tax=Roseihalotalea indica TaxID=2867963 RepID=A0AA49GME1_9BACT|nr:DUF4974 domain-containing protein [Tunicatimonas sp. TK19036]
MAEKPADRQELFQKFLLGQCSPEEKKRVLEILQSAEGDAEFQQVLEQLPEHISDVPEVDAHQKEQLFSRIKSQTQQPEQKPWTALRIAATIALVLAVGIGGYYLARPLFFISDTVTYYEKAVPVGQKDSLTLNDGSVVYLNGGSTIRYASNYGQEVREVVLEGEGFFEVVRQEEKPFIVKTAALETKVLGTSFNVKAYPRQRQITVAVLSGKVQVLSAGEEGETKGESGTSLAVLTKDHIITYLRESGSYETWEASVAELIGWREGKLVFRKDTFEDIAHSLENQYGVQVTFNDESLRKCRFTASFEQGTTLEEVLELLNLVHGTQYQKKGENEYILYGQGC